MKFRFYDPKKLVPAFRHQGITLDNYKVCYGCAYSGVNPLDSIHPKDDFSDCSIQSDELCQHCASVVEEERKPLHLHRDKNLDEKVAEIEEMIKMASS